MYEMKERKGDIALDEAEKIGVFESFFGICGAWKEKGDERVVKLLERSEG